tara:strand:- start:1176 stop:1745 length:570 start_codon:yes stop_codon:yes gene_type:complete
MKSYNSILSRAKYLNASGDEDDIDKQLALAVMETMAANAVNELAKNSSQAIKDSAVKAGTAAGAGGVATAGSTALAATASTAAWTAWVPVVGQVVAIVAVLVGVGMVINGAEKARATQLAIKNMGMMQIGLQQEIDVIQWQTNATLQVLQNEIAMREKELRHNTTLLYASGAAVFVAGLLFVYSIKKIK